MDDHVKSETEDEKREARRARRSEEKEAKEASERKQTSAEEYVAPDAALESAVEKAAAGAMNGGYWQWGRDWW